MIDGITAIVMAIDPGSVKCGLAVVSSPPMQTLERSIVPTQDLVVSAGAYLRRHPRLTTVIIGSGTRSTVLVKALRETFSGVNFVVVDEHGSSQRARLRYCREIPPKGWRKLLPPGMRTPEQSYDDWVAVMLAEDYLTGVASSIPSGESD